MDLYKEIIVRVLEKENVNVTFPNLKMSMEEIVEVECYKALQKIKAIIEDDSLEDNECFMKIEEIVCLFEDLGSDGGIRHDYM